ncbi:MAG TPA: TolC family protein [Fibrobacteria bacterium]|nr:TolC family protein [Fibrobacteria bacterium]
MRKFILILLSTGLVGAEAPLTLDQCRKLASENNADLVQARLETVSAEQTRKSAVVNFFPRITAGAVTMAAKDPLVNIKTQGGNLPVFDGNLANLATATQFAYMPSGEMAMLDKATALVVSAVQPVFAGGQVVNGNRLAALGVVIARDKEALAKRDAVAKVEDKYWRLLALAEKRRTLDAYDSLLASLERQVRDGRASGVASNNDLLKVTLKRSELRVERGRLESGLRLSAQDLRRHLGLSEDTIVSLADSLGAPRDPSSWRKEGEGALDRRIELHLLERVVRAEELQADMKRGTMLPTVSVGATWLHTDLGGMDASSNALMFAMAIVPVTGIWSSAHDLAGQKAKARIAHVRLAETKRLLAMGLAKDWDDLQTAYRAARVSEEAVDQAEANLKEQEERYRAGVSTLSDLLEAQVLLQQTRDHRIDSRAEYWSACEAWKRSAGLN